MGALGFALILIHRVAVGILAGLTAPQITGMGIPFGSAMMSIRSKRRKRAEPTSLDFLLSEPLYMHKPITFQEVKELEEKAERAGAFIAYFIIAILSGIFGLLILGIVSILLGGG